MATSVSATNYPLDPSAEGARTSEPASLAPKSQKLRRLARARRCIAWLVLLAPVVLVLAVDIGIRGGRLLDLRGKHVASYAGALVESAVLWGLLLYSASSRRGAVRWISASLFILLATVTLGVQIYFQRCYSTYVNLDALLFATSFSESVVGHLRADGGNLVSAITPPLVCAAALVVAARRFVRPRQTRSGRAARILAPLAIVFGFVIPCSYRTVQASTPDVIYLHAMGGVIKQITGLRPPEHVRPGLRTKPVLPRATAVPSGARVTRPNVLFVITESVRADAHCTAPTDDCPFSPATNAAARKRFPLLQMRSNASTTAISLAVLWSGLPPTASREDLHGYPLLFDYANAAGYDTAYWTSHHMMFANSRLYVQDLPTSHQTGATDLDPLADMDLGARDELLTERIRKDIREMREPFFAVAHYGNTHIPYRIDPEHAPFQPAQDSKAPEDNEAYRNYYLDAVHLQDRTIGEMLRFVREQPFGERTIVVFTSDHGESFREHGQLGHTGAVLDEEIHVPAWIDAPEGTLTEVEAAALASHRESILFHTDLTPTILDMLGLEREAGFSRWYGAMIGKSLLGPIERTEPVPLTNCSGVWGCAFRNWGMMRGNLKLEAREWDTAWHCYDVLADPKELRDLGAAACGDMAARAEALHGGLPGLVK
ncbi:sulfatase-like hydrolase/transferase [Polyangium sp. y55x31]|uniref:sulfatase-like hydrolase/transferase n=1 Tax=Polyangium sp. y55x31 TaxID=3042688 RepID=UPI0024823C6B|nr:sulfatase-like hydrolase/transferase [Polyangium sp. y55x31]MDI1481676.1 sulfatase-like hydrolase/transferase [Polyangium sp. y55x31]